MLFGDKYFPTNSLAFLKGLKSGLLALSVGVGTVTIKISQLLNSEGSEENLSLEAEANASRVHSLVRSNHSSVRLFFCD